MCQEEIIMELKAIIAMWLLLFLPASDFKEDQPADDEKNKPQGRPYGAAPLTYPKKNWKGA